MQKVMDSIPAIANNINIKDLSLYTIIYHLRTGSEP